MIVTLNFGMTIEVDDLNNIDELGKAIAADILCELFNGEDVLEVNYIGQDTS